MTRFKEYARKKTGIKFENDYPYLPYDFRNGCIEGVGCYFYNNVILVKEYYTSITFVTTIDKYGNIDTDYE